MKSVFFSNFACDYVTPVLNVDGPGICEVDFGGIFNSAREVPDAVLKEYEDDGQHMSPHIFTVCGILFGIPLEYLEYLCLKSLEYQQNI